MSTSPLDIDVHTTEIHSATATSPSRTHSSTVLRDRSSIIGRCPDGLNQRSWRVSRLRNTERKPTRETR